MMMQPYRGLLWALAGLLLIIAIGIWTQAEINAWWPSAESSVPSAQMRDTSVDYRLCMTQQSSEGTAGTECTTFTGSPPRESIDDLLKGMHTR